jgi:hypothetical protein
MESEIGAANRYLFGNADESETTKILIYDVPQMMSGVRQAFIGSRKARTHSLRRLDFGFVVRLTQIRPCKLRPARAISSHRVPCSSVHE